MQHTIRTSPELLDTVLEGPDQLDQFYLHTWPKSIVLPCCANRDYYVFPPGGGGFSAAKSLLGH